MGPHQQIRIDVDTQIIILSVTFHWSRVETGMFCWRNVKRSYNRAPVTDSGCEFTEQCNIVKAKSKTRWRPKKSHQAQKSRTAEMDCGEPGDFRCIYICK